MLFWVSKWLNQVAKSDVLFRSSKLTFLLVWGVYDSPFRLNVGRNLDILDKVV